MEKGKVNNWKYSIAATKFKIRYYKPHLKKLEEAAKIMENPETVFDNADIRRRTRNKFALMQIQHDDYSLFFNEIDELSEQHESLVSTLSELYAKWYNKVSKKGEQPKEIMGMQAKMIEDIFGEIYSALKPLELEINPPKGYKKEQSNEEKT